MRHTSNHNKFGFTLVEMLIVAPIVILMIGIFISSIVAMTGDVLSTRSATTLSYNVQDALDRIEQDVKASGGYLSKNNVVIKSPQGFDNGSADFLNVNSDTSIGDMLILNSYATTSNPAGSSQNTMYMSGQPYACDSTQLSLNTPVTYNIVYFVKNNSLWRRVLMPSNYETVGCNGTSVGLPWQQPSCLPTITGTMCVAEDVKLVDGVDAEDFQVSYLTDSGSTTENTIASDPAQSDTTRQAALKTTAAVSITITASDTAAGRPVTHTGTMRATSNNNYFEPTADTGWTELSMNSGWSNYGSTYYSGGFRRTQDGVIILRGLIKKSTAVVSNEIIATLPPAYWPSEQLIFQSITADVASRVDIDTSGNIRVVSGNAGWLSLDGIAFLPLNAPYTFSTLTPLLNSWAFYGSPFSPPAYTIDESGRVHIKGLIRSGTTTDATPIVSLPADARVNEYHHIGADNSGVFGQIGIGAPLSNNGYLLAKGGGNSYLSLQTIYYPLTHTDWTNMYLQNSWTYYASGYTVPQYTKSSDGLVSMKGFIKTGTYGTTVANLPDGYRPSKRLLMSNTCSNGSAVVLCRIDIDSSGNIIVVGGGNAWVSLDAMNFYADQ